MLGVDPNIGAPLVGAGTGPKEGAVLGADPVPNVGIDVPDDGAVPKGLEVPAAAVPKVGPALDAGAGAVDDLPVPKTKGAVLPASEDAPESVFCPKPPNEAVEELENSVVFVSVFWPNVGPPKEGVVENPDKLEAAEVRDVPVAVSGALLSG